MYERNMDTRQKSIERLLLFTAFLRTVTNGSLTCRQEMKITCSRLAFIV